MSNVIPGPGYGPLEGAVETHGTQATGLAGRPANIERLKCPGVGRDAENDRSLCFYFNRKVTDDEMRYLHEVMQRATACSPFSSDERA